MRRRKPESDIQEGWEISRYDVRRQQFDLAPFTWEKVVDEYGEFWQAWWNEDTPGELGSGATYIIDREFWTDGYGQRIILAWTAAEWPDDDREDPYEGKPANWASSRIRHWAFGS